MSGTEQRRESGPGVAGPVQPIEAVDLRVIYDVRVHPRGSYSHLDASHCGNEAGCETTGDHDGSELGGAGTQLIDAADTHLPNGNGGVDTGNGATRDHSHTIELMQRQGARVPASIESA